VSERPPYVCPRDGEELSEGDGSLTCPHGHAFPVRDGIPRFAGEGYSSAFGMQWQAFARTQLDSVTGTTLSADRARRCLGPAWDELDGAQVLECGCGAGRFTEVLLGQGAVVSSVDLSSAVEANQRNFPQDGRHRIAQADVRALPFVPASFDVVFCLGVVQHTPSPEETIGALASRVRPGGWLVIDHYSRRLHWYLSTQPLFRAVLRRLPDEQGLAATRVIVKTLLPLHKHARGKAGTLVRRVSPVQAYYGKFPLDDKAHEEWAFLDTHDMMRDHYKHFRSREQIESTLRALGLADVWVADGGNGVEARGRVPAA
jgi:2-polyprenyl-3-methyl-5-hydroxy-6-metoxy-1,4-benzoquinol methylase